MSTVLGIDVGSLYLIADSDGGLYYYNKYGWPKKGRRYAAKNRKSLLRLIPQIVDKVLKVANGRDVAVEDWNEEPKFHDKRWNKVWVGWVGQFQRELRKQARLQGIKVHTVPRAYTSQTCPYCFARAQRTKAKLEASLAKRSEASLINRDTLECYLCGTSIHADTAAAKEVARRAEWKG